MFVTQMLKAYLNFNLGIGFLVLILAVVVKWLNIPAGNLIDWSIGIASFWWLLAIATIPWNIYFDAKETLTESKISQQKNITVDLQQVNYVARIARWSLIGAIALHLISALALYVLAATGVSNVGYISSGLTLLLTVLRPAIRGYQYLNQRLLAIKKEVKCPREDALELKQKITTLTAQIKDIQKLLDLDNPNSLASQQQQKTQDNRDRLFQLAANLEADRATNQKEREKIARTTENAIAQLNEDSQFLGHVREIIRFVKTA